MVCWLDCETRELHYIVNDKVKLEKFYEYYKCRIMVGYNSRGYDQWILKSILCDFNPYQMSEWIIVKGRKGFEFSNLLSKFPVLNYDCSVGFRSLKELEAFMGHDIRETSVPFDINRRLTRQEIEDTLKYCKYDVTEAFQVFIETNEEFESHMGLIQEFKLPLMNVAKTKAQISAIILGANKRKWDDEFDIIIPDTIKLGKYEWLKDWYMRWAKEDQNYENMKLSVTIAGVPHELGVGGLHGAVAKYYGHGLYIMADVASYYPALMIEYDFLSRNVVQPKKYRSIRDERLVMKAKKDPRQQPRKIVLNGTFGASKDKYNNLYDPRQANNVCIAGQLMLIDLLDKLEDKCQIIQSNTDGILVKLFREEDKELITGICKEWMARTRLDMEFEEYTTVIQKDVNNYIIVDANGNIKRKGAYVKKLSTLDNDMPIVNRAIVDYFTKNIPVATTVMASDKLIDFQKITKISSKYEYGFKEDLTRGNMRTIKIEKEDKKGKKKIDVRNYHGYEVNEKVHRCFASLDDKDGTLYKKHKSKDTFDKTGGTPEKCFIINENILDMHIPEKLDRQWYINLANQRIKDFIG